MMRLMLALLFWSMVVSAAAQTLPITNPSAVEFTSPDHALLTAYEIDIVRADGTVAQTLTIPAAQASAQPNGDWRLAINVQPIVFGSYTCVVRAVSGAVKSVNSLPSETWLRAPGSPSKPVMK